MRSPLIIGVAGGTGSGKTTFAHAVAALLGGSGNVALIAHDSYYRAHDDLSYEQRTKLNYDHPDAYETSLLVEHLEALRQGQSIDVPTYDFTRHNRSDQFTTVFPAPVVIVEGILILADERLRELMDLRVFVDVDADVRILRRLRRDVIERGRSVQSVVDQYMSTVKPMHESFVEPSKQYADLIVPALTDNDRAQKLLVAWVKQRLT